MAYFKVIFCFLICLTFSIIMAQDLEDSSSNSDLSNNKVYNSTSQEGIIYI